VIHTLRDNIAAIGHFHTAGNPGCNDLNEHQELYYPAICRAIAATDYDGYVGQEFTPKGDPLVGLKHAFEVCDV
jgi:hydroxypyruvate isomerase